jgi:hypothetical protein
MVFDMDEIKIMSKEQKKSILPETALSNWLSRMGLNLNPFEYIDAGKDPLIPNYLVDHDQFANVSGDQPSFIFAPAGGGKTAFRVRLAGDCRAGRQGHKIFPVIYQPTAPAVQGQDNYQLEKTQRTDLLRFACQELLLYLVYHPYLLEEMPLALRQNFLQNLSWGLDFPLAYYLNQINKAKSLEPILAAFDPTARSLPNPPGMEDIKYLYKKLNHSPPPTGRKPKIEKRFNILFDLILNQLKFESVYLLIDGVDAFFETANNPQCTLGTISWLLNNAPRWQQEHIYPKYFLPDQMYSAVMADPGFHLLTSMSKITIIKWNAKALGKVIQKRLQDASDGKFDSLTAISDRALRASGHSPEEVIITDFCRLKKISPRSLIRSVDWLFTHHVRHEQPQAKLTPQDLQAVRKWIRSEYSAKK